MGNPLSSLHSAVACPSLYHIQGEPAIIQPLHVQPAEDSILEDIKTPLTLFRDRGTLPIVRLQPMALLL